jgi:sugar O-acyltransferase (sialic acid O-acetyltransferase NeuD family)
METVTTNSSFTLRTLYILGSGGYAKEIRGYLRTLNFADPGEIVFVDDNSPDAISVSRYQDIVDDRCVTILGSGQPHIKKRMAEQVKGPLFKLIHPLSHVGYESTIGMGTVIAPHAVVSNNTIVGNHVLVNYGVTIGHDTEVGDFCVVAPNASISGWVKVGDGSYVGSGAQIKERLTIGSGVRIGMGATVVKDVPDGCTVIGDRACNFTKEQWKERLEG